MKICFITGQKELNQCGITDYVELITKELEKLGHGIERYFIHKDSKELTDLPNADLYSLQFAPYSYANNGIPKVILNLLSKKLQNRKVHLNFHEIWVGAYPRANWKEKVTGLLQKMLILNFVKNCNPSSITTSNAAAIERLKTVGIPAKFLYLFGNIPYASTSKYSPSKEMLKVAFFGTPYTDFPYHNLSDFFSNLSKARSKKLEIIMIGRQRKGGNTDRVLSLCKENNFLFQTTGELSPDLISKQLQQCTVGVSTTPYDVIGKSGATAAMLEHGLPVLAYDDGDTPHESLFIPDQFKDQIFLINNNPSIEKFLQHIEKPRKSFFDGVAHTANKMLRLVS